jgi:hypothetical protein
MTSSSRLCVLLLFACNAAVAAEIPVENKVGHALYLWSMPETPRIWQPKLYLNRDGKERLALPQPTKYYLVVEDTNRQSHHLGWFDLHREVQSNPNAKLELTKELVYRAKDEWAWSHKLRRWVKEPRTYQVEEYVARVVTKAP